MKKFFTLVFALACFASLNAYDAVYIVGDSSPAGWSTADADLAKTTMTQVSENVFEWTGVLTQTTGEGFKLLTSKSWNPGMHPSTAGLVLNEVGSDVVALPYSGDPDTKWKISETAEYTLRVTFRETDVLVELEKAGEVGSIVPMVNGVYQISTAALCEAFAQDVNSGLIPNNCSAVLTQDIDLSSIDAWTAIGTDGKKFIGTFDGQGHRIKGMKLDSTKKEQGFFGVAGAGATIKNLIIDASCTIVSGGQQCFAAFVGCCNNNGTITFENCGNEAAVVGQKQNNAAFLGCNYGSTQIVFNNCYNTGKVSGGWENAAFSGWCGGGATFNNCYNIGEVTEGETWARGTKTINNCYQTVGSDNGVVKVTAEQVASGELCFKLNGDQNTIAWYQTIGTDTYPVPFSTNHSQVYANGEMKCDGTSVEGGTLTYSNESTSVIPPHTYQNGFCAVCGKYQENALTAVDGWYEISEPWQLRWMAQSVTDYNDTYGTANIKLLADIDYTEYKSTLFGNSQATAFRGTFDGQQHTITIDVVNNGTSRTGLFAYINAATIKNLIVEGNATSAGNNCVGGLGGRSDGNGTLIENIIVKTNVSYTGSNGDATCGGFFANMESEATLKNCAFLGSIKTGTAEGNGLLVGWAGSGSNNKYINCYVAPVEYTQNGNSADFARNNPSTTNCFRVAADDATLASGEFCYNLNGDQSTIAWYQKLGEDQYPVPFAKEGTQVYLNATYLCPNKTEGTATYSNSSESTIPDHTYTDGFCEYCDKADVNYLPLVGSAYEIDNMYKLHWFSCIVKDGNVEANANLTADIEMESDNQYAYTPIGTTEHPYVGFFNGQGHSVTLRINNPGYDYQGLFGVVTDGARIEKVVVKGFVTGKAYVGGIAGGTNGGSSNAKQTNIWYCGNEATITAKGNNGAGIIGVNMGSQASIIVTSCYNTGNVTSANEGGAISGWLGGGWSSVRNCYNSGIVKNGENVSKAFCRNQGCFFTNCYYTETSGTDNSSENVANGTPAMVADATLASGELAYKLSDGFYQMLGTDAYPTTEFTKPSVSYVGDAGYATMYDTTTGYTLNGDIKAYAAVLKGEWITLTEVENVPESTPVVLKGTYYNKVAANLPAINVANSLVGTDADVTADGTMYILADGPDGVGFYKASGDIPAGKAYIQSSSSVKAFFFEADDATGINEVNGQWSMINGQSIYNIAGQRVSKMQKGINIVNGKKILF